MAYATLMDNIGYHYVIELNGAIKIGRPLDIVGAHVRNQRRQHRRMLCRWLQNKPVVQ